MREGWLVSRRGAKEKGLSLRAAFAVTPYSTE